MPEAAHFRRLFAAFEQRLQAEADAEERHAGGDALDEGFADPQLVERAHHLAEVADAGQDDFRRGAQSAASRTSVYSRRSRPGVLDGAQIARAVIEDRDHSSPLVDGNWSFSRASFEQAYFIARAKHLKIASIL